MYFLLPTDCHFDPTNIHLNVLPGDCYYDAVMKGSVYISSYDNGGKYINTYTGFIQIPEQYAVYINEISTFIWFWIFDNDSARIRDVLYIKTISSRNEALEIKLEEMDHILKLKMSTPRKRFEISSNVTYETFVNVGIVCIVDVGIKLYQNGALVGADDVGDDTDFTNNGSNAFMLGKNPSTVRSTADTHLSYRDFYVWLRQVSIDVFSGLYNRGPTYVDKV